jgi:hypothetical protein
VSVAHSSGDQVGLNLYAGNNLNESSNSGCDEGDLPDFANELIYSSASVYDGPDGLFQNITISGWVPQSNYNTVLLSSHQAFSGSNGSFLVKNITIKDLTSSPSYLPNPTNVSVAMFGFRGTDAYLTWDPVPGAAQYGLKLNGQVYDIPGNSTNLITETNFLFRGLTYCSLHTFGVIAYNSGKASNYTYVQGLAQYPPIVQYSSDISSLSHSQRGTTGSSDFYVIASSEVILKPGFVFTPHQEVYNGATFDFGLNIHIEQCPNGGRDQSVELPNAETISTKIIDLSKEYRTFEIFPNPTTGIFDIQAQAEIKSTTVKDSYGRDLITFTHSISQSSQIDISSLPEGIYLIEVVFVDGGKRIKRLVKVKSN